MSKTTDYAAACAKVRAILSKRLTAEELSALEEKTSIRALSEVLHASEFWPMVTPTDSVDELKEALQKQTMDYYERLCLFLPKARDKEYMSFFLKRKDLSLSYSNEDYQAAWDCIEKSYRGISKLVLKKLLGEEADILNLIYLLRLRRFPESLPDYEDHLIPVRLYLKKNIIESVVKASDDDSVREVLAETKWNSILPDYSPSVLDKSYADYMKNFSYKLIRSADASAAVPVAFMMWVELQRQEFLRLAQKISLGIYSLEKGGE